MLKQLGVPALCLMGLLFAASPPAGAQDGRYRDEPYVVQQEDQQGEHDSRDFGHSRGRGRGRKWGYEEHDRRNFGHSRGRGRGRGLARNQGRSYCNPNGFYDERGNWWPDPNCAR